MRKRIGRKNKQTAVLLSLAFILASAQLLWGCGGKTGAETASGNGAETSAQGPEKSGTETGERAETTGGNGEGEAWTTPDAYLYETAPEIETVHAVDAEDLYAENTGELLVAEAPLDAEEDAAEIEEKDEEGGEENKAEDEEEAEEATEASLETESELDYATEGTGFRIEDGVLYITAEGEYTLTGVLEGHVVVDAPEDAAVRIILNGATIRSADTAAVWCTSADRLTIRAARDTYNELLDERVMRTTGDADEEEEDVENTAEKAGAAVFSECDLTIGGKGALVIRGGYNNGITVKGDLSIKKTILKVTAAHHGLKGNDSVSIRSGCVIVIAETGDGIRTENSDLSGKGNQRGNVEISGGAVDIYAARDGISAACDVCLSGDGALNISTDTYSDYSGSRQESGRDFYLIVSVSDYEESDGYYAYYYNSEDRSNGTLLEAEPSISVSGGRSYYYGLLVVEPEGYDSVTFVRTTDGKAPDADGIPAGDSINSSQNGYLITTLTTGALSGDYVSLSLGNGGSGQAYSTKGIKAANSVTVAEEIIVTIRATDDGIHANADAALESGAEAAGTVTIAGGALEITSSDDGIHADSTLLVSGGLLRILSSYEGLEGNQVEIAGGSTFVYASDDAVNACSTMSGTTPCVTVSGGYLEVTTPSGDTDAIDSNGAYVQHGGYVVVRGGSTMGMVAGSLDTDRGVTVDGGAIVAVGGICETPEESCNAYAESGTTLPAGIYSLTDRGGNAILTFELDSTYQSFWIASDLLMEGETYTLSSADKTISSWTQEAGTMGAAGNGGFGGGGFGGGPGGGRR